MRAGPLSDKRVLRVLKNEFVNTWIVAKDLGPVAAGAEDESVRNLAQLASANYLYPVDSQVYSADGELLDHVCANDLSRMPNRTGRYLELLDSANAAENSTEGQRETKGDG